MSYLDAGYDQFLQKTNVNVALFPQGQLPTQFDSLGVDNLIQEMSASKLIGGVIQSRNGKIKIDLDNEIFTINDGTNDFVQMGVLSDGTTGFLVIDSNQNKLMQFTNTIHVIKSALANLEINLDNIQILVRDDQGNLRAMLGKDLGGF